MKTDADSLREVNLKNIVNLKEKRMNPKKAFAQKDTNETAATEEATEGAKNATEDVVASSNDNEKNATNAPEANATTTAPAADANTTTNETKTNATEEAAKAVKYDYKKQLKVPAM